MGLPGERRPAIRPAAVEEISEVLEQWCPQSSSQ
jgi:hypothetical protein